MSITKASVTTHIDDKEDEKGSMETIMKLKIVMIVLLFFIRYLGLIPAYSSYFRSSKVLLSIMNSFAGGVFLAMSLIHILPESAELYYDTMKEGKERQAAALLKGNSTKPADNNGQEE